jgi:hypothetical protein
VGKTRPAKQEDSPMRILLGLSATRHCPNVGGGQALSADAPLATGDFVYAHPGKAAHSFALYGNHRVRHRPDHFLLLDLIEDALDNLDINKRHGFLLLRYRIETFSLRRLRTAMRV